MKYDDIARALHEELLEAGPPEDQECVFAWNAVRGCAARLSAVFDSDPQFDHEHFLSIVMNGATL